MHEGQAAKQEVMEKLGEVGEKWAEEGGRVCQRVQVCFPLDSAK